MSGTSIRRAEASRVTVVTGGSRGIGRATAEAIAADGSDVVIVGRDGVALDRAAAEIADATGARIGTCRLDLGIIDSIATLRDYVASEFGTVDGIVNNAAVLGPIGRIDEVDLGSWVSTLVTNVAGVAAVVAELVPLMAERGGSVVNLSGGGVGGPTLQSNVSAYTTSKAAVATLTETLADELAPLRIRVNAIAPGPVATSFLEPVVRSGRERAGAALFDAATDVDVPTSPSTEFLDFVLYLLADRSAPLTGRLLSARWDAPARLEQMDAEELGRSLYRMRRIDRALFEECATDERAAGR